jgi:hypothetical protein
MPFGKEPFCKNDKNNWGAKLKFFKDNELKEKKCLFVNKHDHEKGIRMAEEGDHCIYGDVGGDKWRRVRGLTGQPGTFSFESTQ